MIVRAAEIGDLPAILAIYNQIIATSTAVYTRDPVDLANRRSWFDDRHKRGYPILVAEDKGVVAGFSSFGDFRAWWGFRYTVEHMVHVQEQYHGQGIGRLLIEALEREARALDKHVMIGAIDAANEGSIRFHARLGFQEVGRLPEVGHKFGRWLDLVLMQKVLDPESLRAE